MSQEESNISTPKMFVAAVKGIVMGTNGDEEQYHIETDALREKVLIELGYGEGIELIRSGERWYSLQFKKKCKKMHPMCKV